MFPRSATNGGRRGEKKTLRLTHPATSNPKFRAGRDAAPVNPSTQHVSNGRSAALGRTRARHIADGRGSGGEWGSWEFGYFDPETARPHPGPSIGLKLTGTGVEIVIGCLVGTIKADWQTRKNTNIEPGGRRRHMWRDAQPADHGISVQAEKQQKQQTSIIRLPHLRPS